MKILAIETSAGIASVALRADGHTVGEFTLQTKKTHSEILMPMVDALLHAANLQIQDVDLLASSGGPGSFTGVRIGAATILGLAFGRELPCIGVSTLYALAFGAAAGMGDDVLLSPVMDARHGNFYNALFVVKDGVPVRLCEDRLIHGDELAAELQKENTKKIYIAGDGCEAFLCYGAPVLPVPERLRYQSAASVAAAAEKIFSESEDPGAFTDAAFRPSYIRPSQAERERMERMK